MRSPAGRGRRTAVLMAAALLAWSVPAVAARAQAEAVRLTTPYAGVAVEPGNSATFELSVQAGDGERVALEVDDVPAGWTARLRGGGFDVSEVIVDADSPPSVQLEVAVPDNTPDGDYQLRVSARGASGSDQLILRVEVRAVAGGSVALVTDFPALRGQASASFNFSLTLENETPRELQFDLQAVGPEGWTLTAQPSGESQASSLTVAGGSSAQISVDARPPADVVAGMYPIKVLASAPGQRAEADLAVEITGTFDLLLTTPDQRLNAEAVAGRATTLNLLVANEGSAPLMGVDLTATPPSGWDVTFDPEVIEQIAPGQTADVTATITPAGEALAGDYRITMRASVPEANDQIEIRTTVNTSALWGFVGVGIIAVAFAGLAAVFRRFGRR